MPAKPTPVAVAEKSAAIPKRPVIQHSKLLYASLQMELEKANNVLHAADTALTIAASERDREVEFAHQKFDAIREGLDAERADIITSIDGIEAALKAMSKEQKGIENG
jgi:hypothetical protein